MKYGKKQAVPPRPALLKPPCELMSIGMLYTVEVRLATIESNEKIKHKILLIGCEFDDIERKIKWMFDLKIYKSISITKIDKVREKVHFLSTVIIQDTQTSDPVVKSFDGTKSAPQLKTNIEEYDPRLFAIGISTTMMAKDGEHALRKLGHALVSTATECKSHSGASLSDDSTITIEEVPRSSGFARPRDVSAEINRARVFRG